MKHIRSINIISNCIKGFYAATLDNDRWPLFVNSLLEMKSSTIVFPLVPRGDVSLVTSRRSKGMSLFLAHACKYFSVSLISAHYFPPFSLLSFIAFTNTPLAFFVNMSIYFHLLLLVLVFWTSKGKIGRIFNGVHIGTEGQDYTCFTIKVKGSWTSRWNSPASILSSSQPLFYFPLL